MGWYPLSDGKGSSLCWKREDLLRSLVASLLQNTICAPVNIVRCDAVQLFLKLNLILRSMFPSVQTCPLETLRTVLRCTFQVRLPKLLPNARLLSETSLACFRLLL